MNASLTNDELDCSEGCSDEFPHKHKWEIEPNPYNSDFDVYVTDDDVEACEAFTEAAEQAWDRCAEGEEVAIKIRRNKVTGNE